MDEFLQSGLKTVVVTTMANLLGKEYIRDYREPEKFIGYCKQCDRYNSC
jgi:hypothetical protein